MKNCRNIPEEAINHRSWTNDDLKPVIDALVDQAGMTLFRVIYDKTDWEATNENASPYVMNWDYYNQVYSSAEFEKMWGLVGYLNQKGISNGVMFNFQGNGPAWLGVPRAEHGHGAGVGANGGVAVDLRPADEPTAIRSGGARQRDGSDGAGG